MRIDFDDGSYIEAKLSNPGKVGIIMGASNKDNPLQFVVNCCEITLQEFSNLVNGIGIPLPPAQK
jgi:hypothetical protein